MWSSKTETLIISKLTIWERLSITQELRKKLRMMVKQDRTLTRHFKKLKQQNVKKARIKPLNSLTNPTHGPNQVTSFQVLSRKVVSQPKATRT
jgi:hypothetical protein